MARHHFTDKHNAATPRVGGFLADIETQIHFFKIAVERDRQTEQTRVEKEETDHADKRFAVFEIDLGAGRDKRRENARIDGVIEHGYITPVGSEERLHKRSFALNVQRPTLNVQR